MTQQKITTEDVRQAFIRSGGNALDFDRWFSAEAAKNFRDGKITSMKDIEGSLIDWDVMRGYEPETPEIKEAHSIAAWIARQRDKLEEDGRCVKCDRSIEDGFEMCRSCEKKETIE